jgi:hypothetical protein
VPETLKQEVGELQLHEFLREVQRDFDERTLRGLGSQEMYRTPFTKLHTLGVERRRLLAKEIADLFPFDPVLNVELAANLEDPASLQR